MDGTSAKLSIESYIYAFLREMCSDCVKERRTPSEPETFSTTPAHITALKVKKKHPPLQEGQDPLDHTPVLRLVGYPCERAVARITCLAIADERQARICIRHVAQHLRWTVHLHSSVNLFVKRAGTAIQTRVGVLRVIAHTKQLHYTMGRI